METFFGTLASVMATLVGLLVAALTAYFIFTEERAAQFDVVIAQQRIEIRDRLATLLAHWPTNELSPCRPRVH